MTTIPIHAMLFLGASVVVVFLPNFVSMDDKLSEYLFQKYTSDGSDGQSAQQFQSMAISRIVASNVHCAMACVSEDLCDAFYPTTESETGTQQSYGCLLQKVATDTDGPVTQSTGTLYIKRRSIARENVTDIEEVVAELLICSPSSATFVHDRIVIFSTDGKVCILDSKPPFPMIGTPAKFSDVFNVGNVAVNASYNVESEGIVLLTANGNIYNFNIEIEDKKVMAKNMASREKNSPFLLSESVNCRLAVTVESWVALVDKDNRGVCYDKNSVICRGKCEKGEKSQKPPVLTQDPNCKAFTDEITKPKYDDVKALAAQDMNNIYIITSKSIEKFPRD